MSKDESSTLMKIEVLGDLTKPATVLIEKIAAAAGILYAPTHEKRMAKAKAESALIEAEGKIKIGELERRALTRWVAEETKQQENIEAITGQALPLLNETADPSKIEDDWIANFFSKARIVSDKEMQELWAKVLAGQANESGLYLSTQRISHTL